MISRFAPVTVPARRDITLTLRPAMAADAERWAVHVLEDLEHLGEHLPCPRRPQHGVDGARMLLQRSSIPRRPDAQGFLLAA
jgi:hypothetical protein